MSTVINTSAQHVFEILKLISNSEEPLGVTEVSRRMQLPTSTVHRALTTLEESDYIRRYQNSAKYETGAMPQHLAHALFNRLAIRRVAIPFLERMSAITRDTVSLCVQVGWYSLRVAVIEGEQGVYHYRRPGEVSPLHVGMQSKAMLALLEDKMLKRFFDIADAPERMWVVNKRTLQRELRQIRSNGYAKQTTELQPNAASVALAVCDENRNPIASLAADGLVLDQDRQSSQRRLHQLLAVRDELQTLVYAEPARYRNPFAHIDPDTIIIATSNDKRAAADR